ncbi:hypothetical protein AURDEDRAFT_129906 [Auricularia subglabra TFB-10046 SS5]|uniref:Transmembrane protein n=1 Tax=Auricularia subglabra (strain TFB-10046 / SS5) TaxID=717982 RepID=J0LGK3_AURST|nr:hypothetical protein AURDEDRAFT_129906 [Auricularia subglabra TFB-10046 SS5]
MASRAYALLLLVLAFAMFVAASPVAETRALAARHNGVDSLDCILNVLIQLKADIFIIIEKINVIGGKGDCSSLIGQIVVLINAAVAAIVEIGIVINLRDTVKIGVIAQVCADILIAISACVGVVAKIAVNVNAAAQLDLCLQGLFVQLNVCIAGLLKLIAPLCVGISINVSVVLKVVLGLVGLL